MKAGDYLYASCSAVLFGRVLAVEDDRCTLLLFDPSELDDDDCEWDEPYRGKLVACDGPNLLTVPIESAEAIGVPHVDERGSWTGGTVVLDTPGDGCFRCTKCFLVLDGVRLDAPFWDSMSRNTIGAARANAVSN